MKAFLKCLMIGVIFALTSCSTTEEIWINKDNTVKREVKMDMSMIVPFLQMGDMFDEEETEESDEYSLEDEMDKEVEQGGDYEEEEKGDDWMTELFKRDYVDTLIDFRSIMLQEMEKEGLTEDQMWESFMEDTGDDLDEAQKEVALELMQSLMKSSLRIKVDAANEVYFFSMIQDFENADELNSGANMLNGLSKFMGDDMMGGADADPEQEAMMKLMMGGSPVYNLGKKEFKISRSPLDLSDMPEDVQASLTMMQAFMGGMDYKYIIHVPKKVKKINVDGAEIKGNTVTFSVPMPKLGKGEDKGLDVKIKYK